MIVDQALHVILDLGARTSSSKQTFGLIRDERRKSLGDVDSALSLRMDE